QVFSSIPDIHSFVELRAYEGKIDEICWLICKKHYLECLRGDQLPHLPDHCLYQLFRVFCLLADLIPESENGEVLQVILHTSEVGLIASQIVNSLGSEWDQDAFDQITTNILGSSSPHSSHCWRDGFSTIVEERGCVKQSRGCHIRSLKTLSRR
ncbi:hypothetical protein WDU94_008903, partial [Cyamophila willieti]